MKSWLGKVWTIAKLDYLQKVREKSSLAVLLFFMFFMFFCFPDKTSPHNYSISLNYGKEVVSARGYYNSDWIGLLIIVYFGTILLFGGIYFIRKTLRRDKLNGYGEFMATSNVSKTVYFEGKRLSNFLYLSSLMLIVEFLGIIIQILRQEIVRIDFLSYLFPFVVVVLPFVYFLSTLALVFEIVPFLKKSFGNLLIFIVGIALMVVSINLEGVDSYQKQNLLLKISDVSGISYVMNQLNEAFYSSYGHLPNGFTIFGNSEAYTDFFQFQFKWDLDFIISRLIIVAITFAFLYVFQLFIKLPSLFVKEQASNKKHLSKPDIKELRRTEEIDLTVLNKRPVMKKVSVSRLFYYQMLALFRNQKKVILLLLIALIVQWLPLPADISQPIWIIITILPIFIWSSIGLQKTEDYLQITKAFPTKIAMSHLVSQWGLWLLYFSGTIIKLLLQGNILGACNIFLSLTLIVVFAYLCNQFTHSEILFEVVYIILWYIELVQQVPLTGLFSKTASSIFVLTILCIFGVASTIAFVFKQKKSFKHIKIKEHSF